MAEGQAVEGVRSPRVWSLLPGQRSAGEPRPHAALAPGQVLAATSGLLVGAAVVSFLPPINLGPRNIVAYVAFFEIARHLMRYTDEAAEKYFALRRAHPRAEEWGVGPGVLAAVDWFFTLCCRGDHEETLHERTTHAVA